MQHAGFAHGVHEYSDRFFLHVFSQCSVSAVDKMKPMTPAETGPALTVERFFQFSLLGLVVSGYLAVAGSGYLDNPTLALAAAGLAARAFLIAGLIRVEFPERLVTFVTLAYVGFFLVDYFLLSRDFLTATAHLVFFLAVFKILTAKTNRDFLYTAIIAFLELLA